MQELVRTKSGKFSLSECYTLEQIADGQYNCLNLETALSDYQWLEKIKSDMNEQVVIVNKDKKVLAMYGPDGKGYLKNIRGLW